MKKLFMTLVAVVLAVSANAQWFVGGTVGISSVKNAGADNETTYKIIPEFGYNVNTDWTVGIALGFGKGNSDISNDGFDVRTASTDQEYSTINPYIRYKIASLNAVSVYSEFGFGYSHFNDAGDAMSLGIRPVVTFNVNKHVQLVSKIGFLGYKSFDPKSDVLKTSSAWGLDMDGNNIQFGIYYNF